jgi:uncharacterized membrane protein
LDDTSKLVLENNQVLIIPQFNTFANLPRPRVVLQFCNTHSLACFFRKTPYNFHRMDQAKPKTGIFQAIGKSLLILVVGLLLAGWLFYTPEGLLGKADAVGYSVCHRIDARSFHLGERQLPLCARCSGMFLGALLGLVYQSWLAGRRSSMPPLRVALVLGGFVLAFGIDGLNSYLHFFPGVPTLYEPQNWLRLFTGTGMGLGIAAVMHPVFHRTVWKDVDLRPPLGSLRSLGGVLLLAGLLDGLVLTENPLILYPLALASAGSVIVLLVMIYTIVWLMLFRQENRFRSLGQLSLALVGGFGLALLQIAVLDWARFLLTGTWGGFNLG